MTPEMIELYERAVQTNDGEANEQLKRLVHAELAKKIADLERMTGGSQAISATALIEADSPRELMTQRDLIIATHRYTRNQRTFNRVALVGVVVFVVVALIAMSRPN